MSSWYVSLGISSVLSTLILKNNGPFIQTPFDYPNYRFAYKFMMFYLTWDKATTWDYVVHHNINFIGIFWSLLFDKNYEYMGRLLMYEMSTPWLSMYMITKNKWFVPIILGTFTYYRIYNNLDLFRYYSEVDLVIKTVHIVNTLLNFYWYSKILRKCYIKLLQ